MKQAVTEICLIAPSEKLASNARQVIRDMGEEIHVFVAALDTGVALARDLIQRGAKVFISRKGTQALISESLPIPVVGISCTLVDYARPLKYLMGKDLKAGFFSYEKIDDDIWAVCDMLGIEASAYYFTNTKDSEDCVRQALKEGVKVGIGGVTTAHFAQKHSLKHIIIENSEETIQVAIETAKQILEVRKEEIKKQEELKIRLERYQTIFDYTHDAIISVDNAGRIELYNKVAENIIGEGQDLKGKNIDTVLKKTRMLDVLKSGKPEIGKIMTVNGTTVSTNRIPIIVDQEVKGAVATFQDVKIIQDSEQKIRIKLHEKGHVAKYHFEDIIGESTSIQACKEMARSYALSDSTVLINGETGTGKELFAQSIHNASERRHAPFIAINCAALSKSLLEAELFGYVEGAFTGAAKGGKAGLFEIAHGGTLFLDEVGEIPVETQIQLLRVLQEKEIRRIGSDGVIPVDIRVITATNRNLEQDVATGKFRQDLYYRLNVLLLELPSLRERTDDIIPIGMSLFQQHCRGDFQEHAHDFRTVLEQVQSYGWPGNVRELGNFAERVYVLLARSKNRDMVDAMVQRLLASNKQSEEASPVKSMEMANDLARLERESILKALQDNNFMITKTAQNLGMSRTTLWRKLKEYNIK